MYIFQEFKSQTIEDLLKTAFHFILIEKRYFCNSDLSYQSLTYQSSHTQFWKKFKK